MRLLSLLALVSIALSGCASVPKINNDYSEGNYGAIIKDVENTQKPLSQVPLSQLFFLCPSYYEVHDYAKFNECADFVLNHPDPSTEFYPGVDVTHVNKAEFQGMILGYRAKVLFEFGQYQAALNTAKKAYALVLKGDNDIRIPFNKIAPLEVEALALIHMGRAKQIGPIVSELENMHTYMPVNASTLGTVRQTALAKIFFAQHNYQSALKELNNDSFDPLYSVITLAVVFVDNVSNDKEIREAALRMPKLYMLSKSYMETGQTDKAKKGLDALLANPIILNMGSINWLALKDRAVISWNSGEKEKAIKLLKKAVDIIESQRSTINTEAYKIGFVADKQQVYQLLVQYLTTMNKASEAFEYAEKGKARALVDILAEKQSFGNDSSATREISELDQLDKQRQLLTTDAVKQAPETRSLKKLKQTQLQKLSPEVSSLISVSEIKPSALQKLVKPDELLVEYYGDSKNLYAFVVSQKAIKVTHINAKGLSNEVRQFRAAIYRPTDNSWKAASEALYKRIIQPISSDLTRKKLLIIPHGPLHYVPFAALYDGHRFMLDRFSIRVLPSANVMQYLKTPAAHEEIPLLALGNPDLNNAKYDLPGAQAEVKSLGRIVPGSKVVVRGQATESLFKRYANDAYMIHIASHGQFNPSNPLKSRLLLARDQNNDGSLDASELYDLKLNSKLVTLSACETGLGDIESGDDVVGLTRGFLFAGSENIVASLWEVDDQSTSELMSVFYRRLKQDDIQDALRYAQLTVKVKMHQHPFYWAAFQLTGSGR